MAIAFLRENKLKLSEENFPFLTMNNSGNILNAFLLFKAGSSNDVLQTYIQ